MNLVGAILVLSILILANYWFRRSVVYPPFLFCAMWLLDLVIINLNLVETYPLHAITLEVILIGATLFSLGGALASFPIVTMTRIRLEIVTTGSKRVSENDQQEASGLRIQHVIFTLLIVAILFQAWSLFVSAAHGVGDSFFVRAQSIGVDSAISGVDSRSWLDYISPLAIYTAVIFQLERRGWLSRIATTVAFTSCIARGGRGGLLILLSALACAYLLDRKRERFWTAMKFARWIVLFFAVLFAGLFVVEKDTTSVQINMFQFAEQATIQYIVGPVAALDYVLTHPADYVGLPHHTFKMFLRIASWFGLISYVPPSPLDVFIFVPFGTNVYTIFKPYITDFGLVGAFGAITIIGFLHGRVYRLAKEGELAWKYMFSLTIYPLIMVIFDDVYTAFAFYINGLLFVILYLQIRHIRLSIFKTVPRASLVRINPIP